MRRGIVLLALLLATAPVRAATPNLVTGAGLMFLTLSSGTSCPSLGVVEFDRDEPFFASIQGTPFAVTCHPGIAEFVSDAEPATPVTCGDAKLTQDGNRYTIKSSCAVWTFTVTDAQLVFSFQSLNQSPNYSVYGTLVRET